MKLKPVIVFVLIVIALLPVMAVNALSPHPVMELQDAPTVPTVPDLVESLRNLAGIAALFTAVVNALKRFGWIGDNMAPMASLILNTVALVGLVALQIVGRIDLVPVVDQSAGILATILTAILSLFFQFFVSRKIHESVLAGMPVIGFSHSKRVAGEQIVKESFDFNN